MNWLSRPVGQRFSIYLCIVSLFEMFVVATQPHCDFLAIEDMCVVCAVICNARKGVLGQMYGST